MVPVDWPSVHLVRHHVRETELGRAIVDQMRDVRMV